MSAWDYFWAKIRRSLWAEDDRQGIPSPCDAAPYGRMWGVWIVVGGDIHVRQNLDISRPVRMG